MSAHFLNLSLFCVYLYVMFLDQTPTPTRFLQNCEEVGLFKEIEEEFLQEQEEEKSKQVSFTGLRLIADIADWLCVFPATFSYVN